MAKGTLRLVHRTSCPLHGAKGERQKEPRSCRCAPRVIGRLNGDDATLGHLAPEWGKKDLREFEDKLHDLRDPNRRKLAERSPLLREWYAEWIVGIESAVVMGKLAPRTVDAYKQRWRRHIAKDPLARTPINAITVRDLRQFVARRMTTGISHRYANELLTPISAMLTDAEIDGMIASNPCRAPRRARHGATQRSLVYQQLERRPPKHFELSDMRALLLAAPADELLTVLWSLATGARRAERLAAHTDALLWAQGLIAIHYQLDHTGERVDVKGSRKREVVMWSGLERLLAARRREGLTDGFIFGPTPRLGDGDDVLRAAMESIGVREKGRLWHALRHSYATHLRHSGVRWEAVEYMMGHRLRDTTGRYVHLVAEDKAAVEAALSDAFGDIVASVAPDAVGVTDTV